MRRAAGSHSSRVLTIIALLVAGSHGARLYGQPQGGGILPLSGGGLPAATFASPPSSPTVGQAFLFSDASALGTCTGGGTLTYAICIWNGSTFVAVAGTSTGLGDPGANSVPYRNGSGTTIPATATQITAANFCSDAGSTDTYACNLSPAIASYATGTLYWFKANTANTGAASINFNTKGALTIKKMIGGITTDLSTGDIVAGQWVGGFYDGTNFQMATQLGTALDTTSTQTITGKTVDGVTPTVFAFLDPTSSVQTQLNGKQANLSLGANVGTWLTTPSATNFIAALTGRIAASSLDATLVTSGAALGSTQCMTGAGSQGAQTPSANCTIDSNGNVVANSFAAGPTPPAVTGTGIIGLGETTGQSCAAGTDCIIANSAAHQALLSNNNATPVPIAVTPASTTNGNIPTYSGTAGSTLAAGFAPGSGVQTFLTTPSSANFTSMITGPVAVAAGGTGTTTPALVAGTNVTITGSWPNQTINSSGGGGGSTGGSVTSTTPVTVNTNTTSDQQLMELALSAGFLNSSKQPFLFDGAGVYTTQTAQTPTITLKIKLCTISGCGSGTVVTLISVVSTATLAAVTNNNWNLAVIGYTATTGATGNLEIHGPLAVDLGALTTTADSIFVDTNTAASSNIDLTAALFVDFTIAFSTNAATANTFTQRSGGVMPFAATAAPVTSFSGDGALLSNSASTGAVTATLATAAAHKTWMNNTGSTAAPGYQSIGTADLPAALANQTSINGITVPASYTSTALVYAPTTTSTGSVTQWTSNGTTTLTASATAIMDLTTNQGAQLKYGPQAPLVSDTDGICAATAGTPTCPAGSILVSGTNEASFANNISMPANGLGTAARALHVFYGFDIGAAATNPNVVLRLRACPTANFTAGNATACSSGGALLWATSSGTIGASAQVENGIYVCELQGNGSNQIYTNCINNNAGRGPNLTSTPASTKVAFTTSSAWTLYWTITYSAATAGNWITQEQVVPSYNN